MEQFAVTHVKGRWLVDGKRWEDLNHDQKTALENFIIDYKEQINGTVKN